MLLLIIRKQISENASSNSASATTLERILGALSTFDEHKTKPFILLQKLHRLEGEFVSCPQIVHRTSLYNGDFQSYHWLVLIIPILKLLASWPLGVQWYNNRFGGIGIYRFSFIFKAFFIKLENSIYKWV